MGRVDAPARDTASELTRLALEDGIGTFIVTVTDPRAIVDFAAEVAPRVREAVTQARQRGPRRDRLGLKVSYSDAGRSASTALVGVHNMLRQELSELRDVLRQVRDGAMHAADARGR